jgi:hypothetical protein
MGVPLRAHAARQDHHIPCIAGHTVHLMASVMTGQMSMPAGPPPGTSREAVPVATAPMPCHDRERCPGLRGFWSARRGTRVTRAPARAGCRVRGGGLAEVVRGG